MIKEFFAKTLSDMHAVAVAKKDNSYMFLMSPKFKFLDIKNNLARGLSLDDWCKANKCQIEKLVFPYKWSDSYDKLSYIGPVPHCKFYSSLKGKNITTEEYEDFVSEFHKRGCVTMMDWLREYNLADVVHFVEALENTRKQYYPDEIDMLKDAVNKALDMGGDLYSPGQPCSHKCQNDFVKLSCKACKQIKIYCTI